MTMPRLAERAVVEAGVSWVYSRWWRSRKWPVDGEDNGLREGETSWTDGATAATVATTVAVVVVGTGAGWSLGKGQAGWPGGVEQC